MVDIVIYILKMFIKMKSEFLAMNNIFDIVDKNKYLIDILKFNNIIIFRLNTIAELDSTGSILSDLSCFSKSEDDLDISAIIQQNQKKREWKEHRPSGEYSAKKRRSGTQKTTELTSSDRIVATTTVVMPKDGNITASSVIEAIPGDENQDPQGPLHNSPKRRKSGDRSRSKLTPLNTNEIHIDTAVSNFI